MFDSLDALTAFSAAHFEELNSAQVSLFGERGADLPDPRLPMPDDWLPTERLAQEHVALGFYLSGHPLDDYAGALRRQRVLTLAELRQKMQGGATAALVAGSVAEVQVRKSARGNRFAFVRLSDPTGAALSSTATSSPESSQIPWPLRQRSYTIGRSPSVASFNMRARHSGHFRGASPRGTGFRDRKNSRAAAASPYNNSISPESSQTPRHRAQ